MIQPEPVERDQYGFWLHPALLKLEDEQPISELPEAAGMDLRFVEFFDDAPEELRKMYDEAGSPGSSVMWEDAVRAWQPTKPEGDCWFLLAVYDTEDGPEACYTRPKGRHRLKLVDFNEETGVGKWACKCGREVTRTAKFMCAVPGAE